MKTVVYIKYAKDTGRGDKIEASLKPDFRQIIKHGPKRSLHTIFIKTEIDIPDELFESINLESKKTILN